MALLNLSLATQTLIKLIEEYFKASPAWPPTAPTVSPQPPDKVSGDALGIYLYHFSEDSHFKNLPAPGNDVPPVRYTPVGLNLYYQLTAHSASENETGTLLEQKMIGIAVKTLHDYPVIDESTEINGNKIFPTELRGADNRLRIVLQPIPYNEAVSFWTAGSIPLKLAAYYQVSVVLLEPEETKSRAGKVLLYGIHTFIEGAPRLDTSFNTLSFNIPGEPIPHEVELRPAQVPVGSRVSFLGSGLTGDTFLLLLKNIRWDKPLEVDPAWSIAAIEGQVSVVVQENISGEVILPGIYSAMAIVIRKRTLPDGRIREFEHTSNECPFTIMPRIDNISAPDANNVVTVKGYIFKHPYLSDKTVQVYIGHIRLELKTSGTLNLGEFKIVNASNLKLRLPSGLDSGRFYPIRIFLNGAESPPNWIKVP